MEIVKTCRCNIAERERERERKTAVRSNRAESRWTELRQVGRIKANRVNSRVAFLRRVDSRIHRRGRLLGEDILRAIGSFGHKRNASPCYWQFTIFW